MSRIIERFFNGDYAGLVRDQVDPGVLSAFTESERAYLIGALVFVGRRVDAKAEFNASMGACGPDARTIARFFLGVGACRDSEYAESRRWFAENFRGRRNLKSAEAEFFVHQGFGFFRFYCSRFSKSVLWSSRAWRKAFAARFRYGMILSADLRGHGLMQAGRVSQGLLAFKNAVELGEVSGGVKDALEASVICYRAHFGLLPRASSELRKRWKSFSSADNYSRGNILLELARALTVEGRAGEALEVLESGAEEIFRHGQRRQKAVWLSRKAHILLLRGRGAEALAAVDEALASLDTEADLAHRLELLGLRQRLVPNAATKESIALLTRATGKTFHAADDPLGRALQKLVTDPQDVETLVQAERSGWRGVFRHVTEREDGLVFYLDLLPGRLVIFHDGDVHISGDQVSETLKRLLLALTQRTSGKQLLVETVWGYKYNSLRHDPVLYNTIYRLRQLLGNFEKYLVASEAGYGWTEKAAARVFERRSPQAPGGEAGWSDVRGLNLRQYRALRVIKDELAISAAGYARALKVAKATATRDLAELVDKGYLAKTGRARATVYVLKNEEPQP